MKEASHSTSVGPTEFEFVYLEVHGYLEERL